MNDPERERDRMVSGGANFGEEPEGSSVSRSETERSGEASPKFAAAAAGALAAAGAVPDPEVTDKPKRRRFTVKYKLSLLKKANACSDQPGEVGALLRREGVYSSTLSPMAPTERGRDAVGAEAKKARPQNPGGESSGGTGHGARA